MNGSKKTVAVVDDTTAENDFQRFIDGADLDFDLDKMDEEDRTTAEKNKRRLVKAIINGHLTIDEKGIPTFIPYTEGSNFTDPMTFQSPTGADFMAMDATKMRKTISKTHLMMAGMTGLPSGIFAKLKGEDYKICQALFLFFMD